MLIDAPVTVARRSLDPTTATRVGTKWAGGGRWLVSRPTSHGRAWANPDRHGWRWLKPASRRAFAGRCLTRRRPFRAALASARTVERPTRARIGALLVERRTETIQQPTRAHFEALLVVRCTEREPFGDHSDPFRASDNPSRAGVARDDALGEPATPSSWPAPGYLAPKWSSEYTSEDPPSGLCGHTVTRRQDLDRPMIDQNYCGAIVFGTRIVGVRYSATVFRRCPRAGWVRPSSTRRQLQARSTTTSTVTN